jgi:hypothetical protein
MSNNKQQTLLIEMVMRQTMYTYDEAKVQLENNDNNYITVIKAAMLINQQKKEKEKVGGLNVSPTEEEDGGVRETPTEEEDGGVGVSPTEEINVNQQIYKEIRCLMDDASTSYRANQEREKRKEEIITILKQRQHEENKKQNQNRNQTNLESVREDNETDDTPSNATSKTTE